jgi:hypothetical protein
MWAWARSFNQSLSRWNVSQVRAMDGMFEGASAFNQKLRAWDVSRVVTCRGMLYGTRIRRKGFPEVPQWDAERRAIVWARPANDRGYTSEPDYYSDSDDAVFSEDASDVEDD